MALVCCFALAGETAHATASASDQGPRIRTVSNRADLIHGGDALVEILVPPESHGERLRVERNGTDISDQFAEAAGGVTRGLVRGLRPGRNTLTASLPGSRTASLTVTDHPATGPIIAGPQTQPWQCATDANGLGSPTDPAHCHAAARTALFYRSSLTGQFGPYDPLHPPLDLAHTKTDQGLSVPFIVRVETGTLDRGIYKTATLYDPTRHGTHALRAYNGKVLYPFVGGCTPRHGQGSPANVLGDGPVQGVVTGTSNADYALSKGFAVMTSSNNYLDEQCNPTVSAETVMMLKEHFAEQTGRPIRYTIGQGCSGGSIQLFSLAAAQPGLLDGLLPMCSFTDLAQVTQEAQDCTLMNRAFNGAPGTWADLSQRNAVQGYVSPTPCTGFYDGNVETLGHPGFDRIAFDPDYAPGCGLPQELVYDRVKRPHGTRCTLQDYNASVLGRRAEDGFAGTPYDNVGVQYGLKSLQSGRISAAQFVDLNARIGSYDLDWNWQPRRSAADPRTLANAYRSGWVVSAQRLADVPVIDLRGSDSATNHTDVHSYSVRARLDRDAGGHGNAVIWTGRPPVLNDPVANRKAFALMDRWLTGIEADRHALSRARKTVLHKPSEAVDACWLAGRKITDMGRCRALFPYHSDARIEAGAPLTDDILKCRLRPLDRRQYPVIFTDRQWSRLRAAFPTGVCDMSVPGQGQQPTRPWLSYAGTPGGRPLGTPPRSTLH
ncbi:DUF6351 family protein [Streptomyces sp. Caat 7-52]|uniref:DUF6351 family protein n=1 Tax=Streptomyces sp. Caat 7-52 TaxID=2949637 RepID=UPI0020362D40|nr:DUF6351 family protein [Streptomyces sp. Caat 7-52]